MFVRVRSCPFVSCILICFLTGLYSTPAFAEALIRIAVVNFEEVSMSYQTFQTRLKDNDTKKDRVVESVTKENEEIRRMEKDLSSEHDSVRVQRLQSIIAQRKVELQTFYYQSMNVLDKERETLISEARKSIYNAIRDIAIQKGFSLVFSENEILYASEDYVDMTADVVQKLNQPKQAKP
ncbi:OmpH family outer membrane protein [bacterium]|nr:OmpH family outer membrane protein [bacterium]